MDYAIAMVDEIGKDGHITQKIRVFIEQNT